MSAPREWRESPGIVILCVLSLAMSGACRKKPAATTPPEPSLRARVSLDSAISGESTPVDWLTRVVPARYSEPLLPEFPPAALADRVTEAAVRVEFVIGVDGLAHGIEASILGDTPHADTFLTACESVLREWRFSPAWRLSRPSDETAEPVVLLPSDSFLVFRFDLATYPTGSGVDVTFEGHN